MIKPTTRKLIIFILLMLSIVITGGSFAYWFESIDGSSQEAVGTFSIGNADSVDTTFVISPEDISTYGYLVPTGQSINSHDMAVEEIPLQYDLKWLEDNEISQINGETYYGNINDEISYDIYIEGSDQVLNQEIYASVYDLIVIEKSINNPDQIILNDDMGISMNYKIRLIEPISIEDYELISQATIVIYFKFYVRLDLYDLDIDFTKITETELFAADPKSLDIDHWILDEGTSLTNVSGETRIYFPMTMDEYSITTYAKIHDGDIGGYGIFFDTYLDPTNEGLDYGYILQYDRGYDGGALIVRPRQNGSEGNPIWSYTSGEGQLIPSRTDDPKWWAASHKITIVVSNIDAQTRQAEFYIDDLFLGYFTYENNIEDQDLVTGFRGWNQSGTEFYSIRVE